MSAPATRQGVKKANPARPPTAKLSVLRQLCNLIPNHLVPQLVRSLGLAEESRTFSAWSQVVSLLFAQFTHAIGLNDVCDALRLYSGPLSAIRGATPPSRNGFSHACRERNPELAEQLFWKTLKHLQGLVPAFGYGRRGQGLTHRFRRAIHVVDSTTIELIACCMDWAKHRRRKAAAKCHLRLDLQSFLPAFAVVDVAKEHDSARAREVCAGIKPGEIVIFDRAYLDFAHLRDLAQRGVQWVTRTKTTCKFHVCGAHSAPKGKILADEEVELCTPELRAKKYPGKMRRIRALVVVEGKERPMEFLTNNLTWSAQTVADLYRSRWTIEVFFKQIKQTLKLADFLGHNARAVRWQVWTALLCYLLLRFQAFVSEWNHSFTRLFTLLRASLWLRIDLLELLRRYGTAGGSFRALAQPEQAYFPVFAPKTCGTAP